MKIDVDFTTEELEDLRTVIDVVIDSFDFHGDMIDMQKPIDKLLLWLKKEGF